MVEESNQEISSSNNNKEDGKEDTLSNLGSDTKVVSGNNKGSLVKAFLKTLFVIIIIFLSTVVYHLYKEEGVDFSFFSEQQKIDLKKSYNHFANALSNSIKLKHTDQENGSKSNIIEDSKKSINSGSIIYKSNSKTTNPSAKDGDIVRDAAEVSGDSLKAESSIEDSKLREDFLKNLISESDNSKQKTEDTIPKTNQKLSGDPLREEAPIQDSKLREDFLKNLISESDNSKQKTEDTIPKTNQKLSDDLLQEEISIQDSDSEEGSDIVSAPQQGVVEDSSQGNEIYNAQKIEESMPKTNKALSDSSLKSLAFIQDSKLREDFLNYLKSTEDTEKLNKNPTQYFINQDPKIKSFLKSRYGFEDKDLDHKNIIVTNQNNFKYNESLYKATLAKYNELKKSKIRQSLEMKKRNTTIYSLVTVFNLKSKFEKKEPFLKEFDIIAHYSKDPIISKAVENIKPFAEAQIRLYYIDDLEKDFFEISKKILKEYKKNKENPKWYELLESRIPYLFKVHKTKFVKGSNDIEDILLQVKEFLSEKQLDLAVKELQKVDKRFLNIADSWLEKSLNYLLLKQEIDNIINRALLISYDIISDSKGNFIEQ